MRIYVLSMNFVSMCLNIVLWHAFLELGDLFNITYSRELYLVSKFIHIEEIVRVKMAVCFEMIVSET